MDNKEHGDNARLVPYRLDVYYYDTENLQAVCTTEDIERIKMAFAPQFLDEVRDRSGLVSVIGRRVRLQKKGREYIGLCPFHNEKSPSFTVNEDKGFYHCFGCGEHGSVFDFVMKVDNLSFPEAVERLAGGWPGDAR